MLFTISPYHALKNAFNLLDEYRREYGITEINKNYLLKWLINETISKFYAIEVTRHIQHDVGALLYQHGKYQLQAAFIPHLAAFQMWKEDAEELYGKIHTFDVLITSQIIVISYDNFQSHSSYKTY